MGIAFSCHSKNTHHKIIIPQEILKDLEILPDKKNNQKVTFSEWEDEVLIKYGKSKSLRKIAKILQRKETVVRKRFHELMDEKIKNN
jgi:DNA-binding NarL/FixJ family response regulator